MVNYENACIYKIYSRNTDIKDIYIGSTTNFRRRKWEHISRCYNENSKGYNLLIYQYIRNNGGWDNFDIVEIKKVKCNDKKELNIIEREFIEKYKSKLNILLPFRTDNEKENYKKENNKKWRNINKDHLKEYIEKNKERKKEIDKKWRNINKDHIKEYREKNKERKKEIDKKYREKNKYIINEKAKEKIKCSCGSIVSKINISRHRKTEKHKKSLTV